MQGGRSVPDHIPSTRFDTFGSGAHAHAGPTDWITLCPITAEANQWVQRIIQETGKTAVCLCK